LRLASRKLPPPVDYFALLEQPRRLWLDPEQLKQKHQQLTLVLHPDRSVAEGTKTEAGTFATINEAYRVLSDPKQRLGHLFSLEGHNPSATESLPNELIDLFGKIGPFVQETDGLLEKLGRANSALAKSLLRPQLLNAQQRANELLDELQTLYRDALDELRRLDALWDKQGEQIVEDVTDLYRRFAYLGRWTERLREAQFQLSI
jgi:curved DNA-binding protein CbpA